VTRPSVSAGVVSTLLNVDLLWPSGCGAPVGHLVRGPYGWARAGYGRWVRRVGTTNGRGSGGWWAGRRAVVLGAGVPGAGDAAGASGARVRAAGRRRFRRRRAR